jgi:hypothetical protein
MTFRPHPDVKGMRKAASACCALVITGVLAACDKPVQPISTSVGLSVATMVRTTGIIDTSGNTCNPALPPAPDVQAFWDGLSPDSRKNPFVGFELWRNTTDGCLTSRVDVYRALVTFNTASVGNLKGLVTKAELQVETFAVPSGVTASSPACVAMTGGAGTLERFGPSVALPPVSGAGSLEKLQPSEPFPSGNTVFAFPRPWTVGTVAGAASPTTTVASGTGGAVFAVDVTSQVSAALNGSAPGMSWMLTSAFEGPLTAPVGAALDCKTPYSFRLILTHL